MHIRKAHRLAVAVAASALVLTGCSSGDGDSEQSNAENTGATDGASEATSSEVEEPTTSSEASGDFDEDATFTWAYSTLPATMVPHRSTNGLDVPFLFMAYDRLMYTNPEGEVVPQLAESVEATDDSSLVLTIREDVTFHDGTPLDAEAVKTNLDLLRGDDSTLAGSLSAIESVEVTGPMEVTIGVSEGLGALLVSLSDRAGIMVSPAALDGDFSTLESESAGAGPFRLVENRPGDRLIYERFEDYWDPSRVHLAGAELAMIADEDAKLRALEAGDIDMGILREGDVGRVQETDGLEVLMAPAPRSYFIAMNAAKSPLDDVEVRRAINHAINRDEIGNELLDGFCTPAVQLFQEGHPAHNPDLDASFFEFDPQLASEILSDAGYAAGEVSFQMDVPNIPAVITLAEALQANLADAGIEVQLDPVEVPVLLENWQTQESDSYLGGFLAEFDPSTVYANWYLAGGSQNPGGFEVEGLAELAEQAQEPTSMEERAPLYNEMAQIVADQAAPPLTICTRFLLQGYREDVTNILTFPHGQPDWSSIAIEADGS